MLDEDEDEDAVELKSQATNENVVYLDVVASYVLATAENHVVMVAAYCFSFYVFWWACIYNLDTFSHVHIFPFSLVLPNVIFLAHLETSI